MEKANIKKVDTGNVVKLDVESPSVEGKFISIEESQMFEHSWALKFNDIDDNTVKVTFINHIAKELFDSVGVMKGQKFMLEFKGMQETKDGSRKYKAYELYVAE